MYRDVLRHGGMCFVVLLSCDVMPCDLICGVPCCGVMRCDVLWSMVCCVAVMRCDVL